MKIKFITRELVEWKTLLHRYRHPYLHVPAIYSVFNGLELTSQTKLKLRKNFVSLITCYKILQMPSELVFDNEVSNSEQLVKMTDIALGYSKKVTIQG